MCEIRKSFVILLISVLVTAGCSDGTAPNRGTGSTSSADSEQGDAGKKSGGAGGAPTANAARAPDTLEGRWKLVMCEGEDDFNFFSVEKDFCVIDIVPSEGALKVKLLSFSPQFSGGKLRAAEVVGKDGVKLSFGESAANTLDFDGTLKSGGVWGTLFVPKVIVIPARLARTDSKVIDPKAAAGRAAPGRQEFAKALSSPDKMAEFSQFVAHFPTSPLVLDAYDFIFSQAQSEKLTAAQVQTYLDRDLAAARQWGPLLEQRVSFIVAGQLARQGYLPELTLKLAEQAKALLTPDTPESWRATLGEALIELGKTEEGVAMLKEVHEHAPNSAGISFALAKGLEKLGDDDAALPLYAELSVLPLVESMLAQMPDVAKNLPSERVAQLWKKKHGDTNGLDSFLKESYIKSLQKFHKKHSKPEQPAGGRVSLIELFTGTSCPPCIAADVTTGEIQAAYPPQEVIVIQYHQHIPRPDPFANEDAKQRFAYYDAVGTPDTYLNGVAVPQLAGGLDAVERWFNTLNQALEPLVAQSSDLRIEMSAQANKGNIALAASVSGLEKIPETYKLRLALVEDEIDYIASNGIRLHEHVMRVMPGGPDGVAPKEGKLAYQESLSLGALKRRLSDGLEKVEEERQMSFVVKPLALEKLHLVGFVQNDKTKEVLQAAMIPVEGDLSTAAEAEAKPSAAPAEAKPEK